LATKMLASTVQFSSDGRSPTRPRRSPEPVGSCGARRSFTVRPRSRAGPVAVRDRGCPHSQDPTACLGRAGVRSVVPCSEELVLDRHEHRTRPTGRCSTHEHHLGMHIRAWFWPPSAHFEAKWAGVAGAP